MLFPCLSISSKISNVLAWTGCNFPRALRHPRDGSFSDTQPSLLQGFSLLALVFSRLSAFLCHAFVFYPIHFHFLLIVSSLYNLIEDGSKFAVLAFFASLSFLHEFSPALLSAALLVYIRISSEFPSECPWSEHLVPEPFLIPHVSFLIVHSMDFEFNFLVVGEFFLCDCLLRNWKSSQFG